MLGILTFTVELLDHLSPEMDRLVQGFIKRGKVKSVVFVNNNHDKHFCIDHPDFTDKDPETRYMLYLGNRLNRSTGNMEPRILCLNKMGKQGKLIPVRDYEGTGAY